MSEPSGFMVEQDGFRGTLAELAAALRAGTVSPRHLDLRRLVSDYLHHFRARAQGDLEGASEALPKVAHVIELKLRLLLPRPPRDEDDEELLEEALDAVYLLEDLEEAIHFLRQRRSERRLILPARTPSPNYPRPERPLRVTVGRLTELAARRRLLGYFEVAVDRFTLAQALAHLRNGLRRLRRARLATFFGPADWSRRTVIFAAVLELIRAGEVRAEQPTRYGPIELRLADGVGEVREVA